MGQRLAQQVIAVRRASTVRAGGADIDGYPAQRGKVRKVSGHGGDAPLKCELVDRQESTAE